MSSCNKTNGDIEIKELKIEIIEVKELKDVFIKCIEFDNYNNVWIGTYGSGLITINNNDWIFYNSDNSDLPSNNISDIAIGYDNKIWVATKNGLASFDKVNWTIYDTTNSSLPVNLISEVEFDKNGCLWIGSGIHNIGGLVKYNDGNWTVYTPDNSQLPYNIISKILVDKENIIWIGMFGARGLVKLHNGNWEIYENPQTGIDIYSIGDLANDNANNLIIGIDFSLSSLFYHDCVLVKFDKHSNWDIINPGMETLKLRSINSIVVDYDNRIYVSDFEKLIVFVNKDWKHIDSDLIDNSIYDLAIDKENKIWIGTTNGLIFLKIDI